MVKRLPTSFEISFLDKGIKPVTDAKDLGVIIDSNLTFDKTYKYYCCVMYVKTVSN